MKPRVISTVRTSLNVKTAKNAKTASKSSKFDPICRAARLPLTIQRRTVYEVLSKMRNHPTADQVYIEARKVLPSLSRTSVFRILDILAQRKLIQRVVTPNSTARYEAKMAPHSHTICSQCGLVTDWDGYKRLPVPKDAPKKFHSTDVTATILGLCDKCYVQNKKAGIF
ncbi:MAG: transcriptional repressor [Thermoguttaceae bacterium]|nr:transcriptional repressor [Thermoguttaceae bacterium]